MLTKEDKKELRGELFRHLDGIATAPAAWTLHKRGVLQHIEKSGKSTVSELAKEFKANEGYLNVALRVLSAQGWFNQEINNTSHEVTYHVNELTKAAMEYIPKYESAVNFLNYSEEFNKKRFNSEPFEALDQLRSQLANDELFKGDREGVEAQVESQVKKHIEGIVTGPTAVALGMNGMFHKYFMETSFKPEEFHQDHVNFKKLLDMYTYLDWFDEKNGTYRFTDKGLFFARRASAYGVTVSYIPTFRKVEELIFGNPKVLWDKPEDADELHVDREMNVWGSGGAHATYFKKIDEVIINMFNKPMQEQPKGIVDMGCGNGAFLEHIFSVIEGQTKRGQMLEEHPLFLVGADFNQAALRVTRANLIQADIWAKVIWGDIGRPDLLAEDLKNDYGIELGDLLNVRTFLDHNRVWDAPKTPSGNQATSLGTYAYRGTKLNNADVEDSLREHLNKWKPYVKKFGLLLIELHTIPSSVTAKNLGRTAATAYDATHGFSDQYILEVDVFTSIASEIGLEPIPTYSSKFPNSELATVSINLLRGK